jgi:hypothetical protein
MKLTLEFIEMIGEDINVTKSMSSIEVESNKDDGGVYFQDMKSHYFLKLDRKETHALRNFLSTVLEIQNP